MKSLKNLAYRAAGLPLLADDVLEFHGARLLLLFKICGTASRIDGLTKMAKLDFFVRYPHFLEALKQEGSVATPAEEAGTIESAMVRHHYGPWDKRYYHILSYLQAKQLISVARKGSQFVLKLTEKGKTCADTLALLESYQEIVVQMKNVKDAVGKLAGSTLKNLIYKTFSREVADRPLGEVI